MPLLLTAACCEGLRGAPAQPRALHAGLPASAPVRSAAVPVIFFLFSYKNTFSCSQTDFFYTQKSFCWAQQRPCLSQQKTGPRRRNHAG
jgi:hypothetical protein